MLRLTDLREILRYVPRFRDRVFVIAIDGAIVEDDNFPNILLDIAHLRSLSVRVAIVHGAAHQVKRFAEQMKVTPSDLDGTGITTSETLNVAITAANRVSHEILEGLSANDLRGACPNAVVAHPAGILGGIDHLFTGRVERVDHILLNNLLEHDIIPVIPPLGCDGVGHSYRLNSDAVAVEVAKTLRAVKLIYLSTETGIKSGKNVVRQMTVEEAEVFLKKKQTEIPAEMVTKLSHAIRAGKDGVERIHIIDGREDDGLLGEVFSNEGIGTLIYTNEYQSIRPAQKKDVRAVYGLIKGGIQTDELVKRTRSDIEKVIGDYFVFEVDRNPVACAALHVFPETGKAELASVYVDPRYENKGIGAKMIAFAEVTARSRGLNELFLLSTQAFNYFIQKGGFKAGTPDDLPPARRDQYDRNNRRSAVLVKKLNGG
ncbi:amino-acid N-acetyltransferase [soil metagenome]